MFLELHMLQNFVPSNLNRDDTGSPKDCEFGGYRRGRVSSQCFKRSIRCANIFAETTKADISSRTKWSKKILSDKLLTMGKDPEQIETVLEAIMPTLFSKIKDGKTDSLIFIGDGEAKAIADEISKEENWEELINSKKAENAMKEIAKKLNKNFKNGITSAPDIALFGRMLASKTGLSINVDAASQVAHAISTNKLSMEFDYFTAIDDLQPDAEVGSSHIGTNMYNSSCYYRYSNIDLRKLADNLANDTELAQRTVEAFIRASVEAIPTGKQNSFAAQQKPEFILATLNNGAPLNLANAFLKPITPSRDGKCSLMENSIIALDKYYGQITTVYGEPEGITKVALQVPGTPEKLNALGIKTGSLEDLVQVIISNISFE